MGFSVRAVCATSCRYLPPFSRRLCVPPASLCCSNNTPQHHHEATLHFTTRHGEQTRGNQRHWFVKLALQKCTFWLRDSRTMKDLRKSCKFWACNILITLSQSEYVPLRAVGMQVFHFSNTDVAEILPFWLKVQVELLWYFVFLKWKPAVKTSKNDTWLDVTDYKKTTWTFSCIYKLPFYNVH